MSDNPFKEYTQEHEAMRQHLANTIGADVERALDAHNWQHTTMPPQPPQAPESGAPAATTQTANPTAVVTTPTSAPSPTQSGQPVNWAEFKDPNGKILGKYNTEAEAVRGMHSLLHMAKEALSQRDALAGEVDQLRQQRTSTQSTSPTPTFDPTVRPERLEKVLSRVKENNGVLDAEDMQEIVDATLEHSTRVAKALVESDREARRTEEQQWQDVDAQIKQRYPDAMRFVDEMIVFKDVKPEVGRMYDRILQSGDPNAKLDATVYLWERYSAANPDLARPVVDPNAAQTEHSLAVQEQVRREEVEAQRAQAGLLGNSAGGAHETTQSVSGASREDIEAAANQMRQLGPQGQGGARWRALTIGRDLNHPIFDN